MFCPVRLRVFNNGGVCPPVSFSVVILMHPLLKGKPLGGGVGCWQTQKSQNDRTLRVAERKFEKMDKASTVCGDSKHSWLKLERKPNAHWYGSRSKRSHTCHCLNAPWWSSLRHCAHTNPFGSSSKETLIDDVVIGSKGHSQAEMKRPFEGGPRRCCIDRYRLVLIGTSIIFFKCLTKVRSSFSPFEFAPANEGIEPLNIHLSPSWHSYAKKSIEEAVVRKLGCVFPFIASHMHTFGDTQKNLLELFFIVLFLAGQCLISFGFFLGSSRQNIGTFKNGPLVLTGKSKTKVSGLICCWWNISVPFQWTQRRCGRRSLSEWQRSTYRPQLGGKCACVMCVCVRVTTIDLPPTARRQVCLCDVCVCQSDNDRLAAHS